MCKKMFCIFALSFILGLAGCSEDKTKDGPIDNPEEDVRYGAGVIGSNMPEMVKWQGGGFQMDVEYKALTRADVLETWYYRLVIDGVAQEPVTLDGKGMTDWPVDEWSKTIAFVIPKNLTENVRDIVVEIKSPEKLDEIATWKKAVSSKQEAGLVEVDGVYWAQGNLTWYEDDSAESKGRFDVADNDWELGCYFKHMSTYGISSYGDSYSGTAYNPAPQTIELADIPEKNGDPCKLVAGANLRMPSYYEIEKLHNVSFGTSVVRKENVEGQSLENGKLFMPFSGGCDILTGVIAFKNELGAYWYSGQDLIGEGGILLYGIEYPIPILYYNTGTNMALVRCVRDIRKASYVSHTPETIANNAAFAVEVVTDPGDMDEYKVALVDVESGYEIKEYVTSQNPTAKLDVPENTDIVDIVYEVFVNDEPTGKRLTHPGLKNYAFYASHTPTGTVAYEAFTLKVKCQSDMDSFDVEVKTGTTSIVKATGSKSNLEVSLAIPQNDGEERALDIYVNGVKTGRKVTQEAKPLVLSLIWSTGYLTVKDGAYAFAGEQELGMFFRYKSRYGIVLDAAPSSSSKYTGTAYGPAPVQMSFASITYDDVDPCTLVEDGNSWRMPTFAEWEELFSMKYELEEGKYRMFYDATQEVYLTPCGQLKNTGIGVLLPTVVRVWSSSPGVKDPNKQSAVAYALLSTSKPTNTEATHDLGMMVRCVRDRQ